MALPYHDRYDYVPIVERADYDWPDGKRLAFYIALNVEHFAFGEGLGHTPTEPGPAPDARNYAWRDYGLRVGIWRIFDLLDQLGLPACHLLKGNHRDTIQVDASKFRVVQTFVCLRDVRQGRRCRPAKESS